MAFQQKMSTSNESTENIAMNGEESSLAHDKRSSNKDDFMPKLGIVQKTGTRLWTLNYTGKKLALNCAMRLPK